MEDKLAELKKQV